MSDRRYQWRGGCVDDVGNGRDRHEPSKPSSLRSDTATPFTLTLRPYGRISRVAQTHTENLCPHSNDVVR